MTGGAMIEKPRARDIGVPFEGEPGRRNAITDVTGVAVGHVTLIAGDGPLRVGVGPIRTGVTAILPRGRGEDAPVFSGWFALNGNGEMTGSAWIEESGLLTGPVMLTNTHSVGAVRDAVIAWQIANHRMPGPWSLPVVAETWDGWLNDINGFHVRAEHAFAALDSAATGPVAEGGVGGGTGMVCHGFKGGIGTASRRVPTGTAEHTVGVLVQANHGLRRQLLVAGVPVGQEIQELPSKPDEAGSIIIVVATDAPLLPHQLKAVARRAALGLARTGSSGALSSGDIFVAFSTANPSCAGEWDTVGLTMLGAAHLSSIFEATARATEEAIVNALVAAETMTGIDDRTVFALPHDRLVDVLRKYSRTG